MINNYLKVPMTEDYAQQISTWQYEGEYEVYNLPSYEEMKLNNYGMTNLEQADNYICYVTGDEVVAYVNMKEMDDQRVFIGIGLKPNYCGKGQGKYFLNDSLLEIKKRYPNHQLFLEVRSWNKRAIKAYQKVGFKISGEVIKKDRLGNETKFTEMII